MINNSQHFAFVLHCHEKGSSRRFKRLNDDHQILFSSDLLNTTFAFRDLINITATVVEKCLSHTKVTYRKVRKAKFKKDRYRCKYISQAKDKLGKWMYHLKTAQYHEGPLFLRPHSGETSQHTSYSEVSNKRYVHYLSNNDTQ